MARGQLAADPQSGFRLISPHPLADALPGVYREAWMDDRARDPGAEPFGPRFLAAFDDLLAPILAALDNLEAYFDPTTTPEDFLAWLGEWVAAPIDETWTVGRRRAFVAQAAEIYRRRGTVAGLREHVEIHTGAAVEVIENGASAWSAAPGGKLPGTVQPLVVVRVTVDDPATIDQEKLAALVQAAKPAHVPHRIEVVGPASSGPTARANAKLAIAAAATAAAAEGKAAEAAERAAEGKTATTESPTPKLPPDRTSAPHSPPVKPPARKPPAGDSSG